MSKFSVGQFFTFDGYDAIYKITDIWGDGEYKAIPTSDDWPVGITCSEEHMKLVPEDTEVNGEDYFTGDPLYEGIDCFTVYGMNRYGSVIELGVTMNCNYKLYNERITTCDDCERRFDNESPYFDDNWVSDDSRELCYECFDERYYRCEDCGQIISIDEAYYTDDDGPFCEYCYDNRNQRITMHDYCYKPAPIFHVSKPYDTNNIPFMGVELEIDKGDDVEECCDDLKEVSDNENLFYLKHDGSLTEGIEIVSHPCDLEYHLEKFPWDKVSEIATDHGFKSHNAGTCGLHVHVSRDGLGNNTDAQDLTIAKIIILVDRFWDELVNFSRRDYSQLNHWAKKPDARIWTYDTEDVAISKSKATSQDDRYKAVNLRNRNTIEFRLFRGTLKVSTIKATLQFVSNLIRYAMATPLGHIQDSKWSEIIGVQDYPELSEYLAARNLVDVPDKPQPIEPKPVPIRFSAGDVIWCVTSNTNNEPCRAIVQQVETDSDVVTQPLYIAESRDGRVHFLVDDEILSNEEIADLERNYTEVAAE